MILSQTAIQVKTATTKIGSVITPLDPDSIIELLENSEWEGVSSLGILVHIKVQKKYLMTEVHGENSNFLLDSSGSSETTDTGFTVFHQT